MFDIGWTELLVIAVVAILVVGPKDLPRMLRTLGNYAGKMRRMANDFRRQFDEAIREAEFEEVRSSVESIRNIDPLKDVKDAVADGFEPLPAGTEEAGKRAEKPAEAGGKKDQPGQTGDGKPALEHDRPSAGGGT